MNRRVVALLSGTVVAQIASLVSFVLVARSLGPDEYGPLMGAFGVGTFLSVVADFGSATYTTRELASSRLGAHDYAARRSSRILIATVALASAAVILVAAPSGRWSLYFLALALGGVLPLEQLVLAPLRALDRNGLVGFVLAADKVFTLTVVALLYAAGRSDAAAFGVALVAGPMIGTGIGIALSRWLGGIPLLTRWHLRNPWRGTGAFGLGSIALGMQFLDVQVVTATAGVAVSGSYAAISRWGGPLGLFASVLTQAAYPSMSAAPTNAEAMRILRGTVKLLVAPWSLLFATFLFAPIIVQTALGSDFADSARPVRWLCVGLVVAVLNQPLAAFLQARSQENYVARVLVLGVALQLASAGLLAPRLGAVGASVAFCVSQAVICGGLGMKVAKKGAVA